MESHHKTLNYRIYSLLIFLFAYSLRRYFFCGLIQGDDVAEFATSLQIIEHGPILQEQMFQRFGMWFFNSLFFKLFGVSEATFFWPTWIMSGTLSVIGYYILLAWGYRPFHAFLAGLFVASTPFEIFIGTLRANDLILSWFMALGLLCLFLYEKKPVLQGISLAFFLWLGFYVKLWVVYIFPALGLYYLVQILQKRMWHGLIWFSIASLFLHGATSIFWKIKLGSFLPFITNHAATYPFSSKDLGWLFLAYPKMIFQGSEFGTTFFGYVPYALLALLLAKLIVSLLPRGIKHDLRFDRFDLCLFVYYISFFLFLNFFPASFKFDQYYSPARIFRYLTPLSFPMSLHLAKLIIDFCRINFKDGPLVRRPVIISLLIFIPLIFINVAQADHATKPGQIYRKALVSILKDVTEQSPPNLLAEKWLRWFLENVYLKAESDKIFIVPIVKPNKAEEYEQWLEQTQPNLPVGTMMITGLGSYVHYGAHQDGFHLRLFENSLEPQWKLFKEYGVLSYLPIPEPARLWRLSGKIPTTGRVGLPLPELYKKAKNHYDKQEYAEARPFFFRIFTRNPDSLYADTAVFFYGMSYLREDKYQEAIEALEQVVRHYPDSPLVPESYYQIALCKEFLNQAENAKATLHLVMKNFPGSSWAKLAKTRLEGMAGTGPTVIFKEAMTHYDRQQWTKAREGFAMVIKDYPGASMADSASYFYAITYWKENQYGKTTDAFKQLVRSYPNSPLVPEAYFHIGLSQRALNQLDQAKTTYRFLIHNFPASNWAKYAQERLKELEKQ